MKGIVVLVVTLVFSTFLMGQESPEKFGMDSSKRLPLGLKVGDRAPQISSMTINGEIIESKELLKEGSIVVMFYRGQWCPVCDRYLSGLNDSLPMITATGAAVLVVGPESFENATKSKSQSKSDFQFIADTSQSISKSFDVLFYVNDKYQDKIQTKFNTSIATNNLQKDAQLPVPATFVINQKGKIIYRQFDYDYHYRASAKEILDALDQ